MTGSDHREAIRDAVRRHLPETTDFLRELIATPSLPGDEAAAAACAEAAFGPVAATVERVPFPEGITDDPDYSSPVPDLDYAGRHNLRVSLREEKETDPAPGRTLLLNSHLDTVPPSQGQETPFEPRIADGVIHGRGACDAKGQIATIHLVSAVLRELGLPGHGNVVAHLVLEEEVGGNGTLAMVRRGEKAEGCVVLEPTTARVYTSVRGAVWFRLLCTGRPGHSGRAGETVSALALARLSMDSLEQYHARLLAESAGQPLFETYPNPMPLTFGRCTAGDWPATAPSRAVVEGVMGFLPNRDRHAVMEEMRRALAETSYARLAERTELLFTYRHDCHVLAPEHPLPQELLAACRGWGIDAAVDAMTASCDSWFYNNQLAIPTVVYGPGTLGYAHTNEERIGLEEIAAAAGALAEFAAEWCARPKETDR